jgi:hypothetical protein
MSEPTTTAVPKSEDKQTEVTPVVEPSPETVAETSAPVPDAPKDVKVEEPTKAETPAVTTTAAEPSSASDPKESDKPAESSKEDPPKSPRFNFGFLKFGRDKKKEKEKAPAPAAEEPAVPTEEPSPADAKPEEKPEGAPADPVKEIETTPAPAESEAPVPQTTQEELKNGDAPKEEKKDVRAHTAKSALKFGRRISSHITHFADIFVPKRTQADSPAKVDEEPPKIKEPTPVAPLENPAADSTPATGEEPRKEEIKEANEPPKIIDSTPAPVVATA